MKYICYPCCGTLKCRLMLCESIISVLKHNTDVSFILLNSKRINKENGKIIVNNEMEFKDDDIKTIYDIICLHSNNRSLLYVFDVTPCMDVFYDLLPLHTQFNTYKRLFIPRLCQKYLPGVDRVLYLDEDVLVFGDIGKIFNIDMKNCPFFGVRDCIWDKESFPTLRDQILYPFDDNYINAGILMIDVTKNIYDRLYKIFDYCKMLNAYNVLTAHDQFIVNMFDHLVYNDTHSGHHCYNQHRDKGCRYITLTTNFCNDYNIYHYYMHKYLPSTALLKTPYNETIMKLLKSLDRQVVNYYQMNANEKDIKRITIHANLFDDLRKQTTSVDEIKKHRMNDLIPPEALDKFNDYYVKYICQNKR